MSINKNLQGSFLNQLRREQQNVVVIITNGYQVRGRLIAFDQDVVVIDGEDGQQLTYKHAISTIIPEHPLPLDERKGAEQE